MSLGVAFAALIHRAVLGFGCPDHHVYSALDNDIRHSSDFHENGLVSSCGVGFSWRIRYSNYSAECTQSGEREGKAFL